MKGIFADTIIAKTWIWYYLGGAIAASLILNKMGATKIILATPVISKNTKREIAQYFDKIVAVETPDDFFAVGEFYQEFPQVEDKEVKAILNSK